MAEHVSLTDPYLHEAKGASTAAAGSVLTGNGDGTATFQSLPAFSMVKVGWYDYNDTATQATPIALTTANTFYDLTNNGLGANTNTAYALVTVPNVYNTTTQRFDFTGLDLGDTLDIRVDLSLTTTSANTAVDVVLELATGTGTPILVPLVVGLNVKTASTIQLVADRPFYLGSALTRNNPAKIKMKADATGATVKVNGWYTRVIKRG